MKLAGNNSQEPVPMAAAAPAPQRRRITQGKRSSLPAGPSQHRSELCAADRQANQVARCVSLRNPLTDDHAAELACDVKDRPLTHFALPW